MEMPFNRAKDENPMLLIIGTYHPDLQRGSAQVARQLLVEVHSKKFLEDTMPANTHLTSTSTPKSFHVLVSSALQLISDPR